MIGRILSVGGFTLTSRVTGFFRDVVLAAVLGAGPVTDAFLVAWRLPNHFRAIFAEGAFNAAFVPAYARIRTQAGTDPAKIFADRVFVLLLLVQLVLLALAVLFTPALVGLLAPGLDPARFGLAVELTRITFPYLLLVTLVTLFGGILNALHRFAAAAAAPILLNFSMIVALALAIFFPTAGHAAAWGVLIAGCLEVLLVGADAARLGVLPRWRWPRFDADLKKFFRALFPATIGSSMVELALLADTFLASFLAAGALSALYFADRINQLPIGVIGIAAGTVLLPEMARRIAQGDEAGARWAQNQAIELTLLLSIPFLVAFLLVPDLIMRALFVRGAFTSADAAAAAQTLVAYSLGLLPFVLIRSVTATFFARGDTLTPVYAALAAVVVNVACKVLFVKTMGMAQVGLALATSIGAWVNLTLVLWFAARAGLIEFDLALRRAVLKILAAGLVLAAALWLAAGPAATLFAHRPSLRDEATLAVLVVLGAIVYWGVALALFGRRWLAALRARATTRSGASAPPE